MTDPQLATVPAELATQYAALAAWLRTVTDVTDPVAARLLAGHARWLLAELLQPGQTRRERLPVAVEASSRWRAAGVTNARFIVGATLKALRTDSGAALHRLETALRLPVEVRSRVAALRQTGALPHAVQLGLAKTTRGWSRRLYLEGGNLQVPMLAWEWRAGQLRERTYVPHPPDDVRPLGPLPANVTRAWLALLARGQPTAALLRQDTLGTARALHVALPRRPVAVLRAELLGLARALQVPQDAVTLWLDRLPRDTELTVVALGHDGAPQLNVYVAPNQDRLPQPGPPPGDLRRTPGTLCWSLRDARTGAWHGWVLFALPDADLRKRPAARSPTVQICVSSAVPDGLQLAAALARQISATHGPLAERLADADQALLQVLSDAGLARHEAA